MFTARLLPGWAGASGLIASCKHPWRSREITWNCCASGPLVAPVRSGPVLANPASFRGLTTGSSWSVLNPEAGAGTRRE
jgi:hypothetical protein